MSLEEIQQLTHLTLSSTAATITLTLGLEEIFSVDKIWHISIITCSDEGALFRLWEHTVVDAQLCLSL